MKCIIVVLAVVALVAATPCTDYCDATFGRHPNPNVANDGLVLACHHGCDIFVYMDEIGTKVAAATEHAQPAFNCTKACYTGYQKNLGHSNACTMGCKYNQEQHKSLTTTSPAATTTMASTDQLPPLGPIGLDQQAADPWFQLPASAPSSSGQFDNLFAALRQMQSGNAARATQPQHQLIGGAHDVTFELDQTNNKPAIALPKPHLLGEEGGVKNPFAADFKPPTNAELAAAHSEPQFGVDVFNPFVPSRVVGDHGSIFDQDFDAFYRNMERMHEQMNALIKSEMNEMFSTDGAASSAFDREPQIMIELERYQYGQPPQRFVWKNSDNAAPSVDESRLDLANHEPSPPTMPYARGLEFDDSAEHDNERRSLMGCWRRRLANYMHHVHLARSLIWITLTLIIISILLMVVNIAKRRRALAASAMRQSNLAPTSVATVGKATMYEHKAKIHTPPPSYCSDNPNYDPEDKPEKNPSDVKIVA